MQLRLIRGSAPRRFCTPRVRASSSYDAVVVGVGAMGSAALYHAAKARLKVLGLEQLGIGHNFGSSHGHTRIFRVAHGKDNMYTPFAIRSGKLWEQLEDDSREKLLCRCGTLNIGPFAKALADKMQRRGLMCEAMTVEEMHKRFPGLCIADMSLPVLLDPYAGFLASDRAIQAQVRLAKRMGAVVREGEKMIQWRPDGSGVKIETNRNVYYAQCLILSSGPWITEHCPWLEDVCRVERQVVGWYDSRPAERFMPEQLPAFLSILENGDIFYGIPSHENSGMKLAKFSHLKEEARPDTVDRNVNAADLDVLSASLKFHFRPEQHRLKESSVCLFTNTPDMDFIIDRHPEYHQVLVCSPCSGMGFKFSSAIGQILVSMILEDVDDETAELLKRFSLKRPTLDKTGPLTT